MSTTCTITGRIHLTPSEQATALAALDRQTTAVQSALAALDTWAGDGHPITDALGSAWNALHDAETDLQTRTRDVEWNPRPIPPGQAGTYALAAANID